MELCCSEIACDCARDFLVQRGEHERRPGLCHNLGKHLRHRCCGRINCCFLSPGRPLLRLCLGLGGPFFVIPFVIAGGTSIVCSLTLEGFFFNVLSNASILLSPSAFEGFCFDVLSPLAKEDVFSVDLDGAMILPLMRAVFSTAIDCRNLLRESEAGVIEFNKDGVLQREDMMSIGQERSKVLHET